MAACSEKTSDHGALSAQREDGTDPHSPASPCRTMARPMPSEATDTSDRLRSGVRTTSCCSGLCERRLGPRGIPIAVWWRNDERQHVCYLRRWEGTPTPGPDPVFSVRWGVLTGLADAPRVPGSRERIKPRQLASSGTRRSSSARCGMTFIFTAYMHCQA